MTTFATGRKAEGVAAEYLENQGFEIIERNYRTRFCEIDLWPEYQKYFTSWR
jgi:Holliday junction resolvase-like predicted endonuclease